MRRGVEVIPSKKLFFYVFARRGLSAEPKVVHRSNLQQILQKLTRLLRSLNLIWLTKPMSRNDIAV